MEQQNQLDNAHDAAIHVYTSNAVERIKLDNRAFVVASYDTLREAQNRSTPEYDPSRVTIQPVPAAFAPGYLGLLG